MTVRVCLAGATGWAGASLARAIARTDDLELVTGVARKHTGERMGDVLGVPALKAMLYSTAEEALATPCDVFVEYTRPESAKENVHAAIRRGAHVVIGTSGLTDDELEELGELARERGVGVLAVGNFSLAAVMLTRCAQLAAHHLASAQYEILDYASAEKPDAPSGTVRELAHKLGQVRQPQIPVPIERTQGPHEVRGATINGIQVHSLRLPGHVISVEVVFGLPDEKLTLRYDAGASPEDYVDGALLAIRRVNRFVGLKRGLDSVMEF